MTIGETNVPVRTTGKEDTVACPNPAREARQGIEAAIRRLGLKRGEYVIVRHPPRRGDNQHRLVLAPFDGPATAEPLWEEVYQTI